MAALNASGGRARPLIARLDNGARIYASEQLALTARPFTRALTHTSSLRLLSANCVYRPSILLPARRLEMNRARISRYGTAHFFHDCASLRRLK